MSAVGRAASRERLASLTSTLGAGVLGAGIGVAAAGLLEGLVVPLLLVRLVMHGWGMADAHALGSRQDRPAWSAILYWACWLALLAIAAYALAS